MLLAGDAVTAVKPGYVLQGSISPEGFAVVKSRVRQPDDGPAPLMASQQ